MSCVTRELLVILSSTEAMTIIARFSQCNAMSAHQLVCSHCQATGGRPQHIGNQALALRLVAPAEGREEGGGSWGVHVPGLIV